MSNVLSFEFEEMPLAIVNGIEAGLINGMAEIVYTRSGDWAVESVCLEGHQKLTPEERAAGKKPWVYVRAPVDLEQMICERLEGDWAHKVADAVQETLASDREDDADRRYDERRDARMEF